MVRNIYFIAFNRYLIRKNTTNYSKSQQTTEAEAGHFLYFDCKRSNRDLTVDLVANILVSSLIVYGGKE